MWGMENGVEMRGGSYRGKGESPGRPMGYNVSRACRVSSTRSECMQHCGSVARGRRS